MEYKTRTFNIPELSGLSATQIEVHLGLYAGYVKHTNLIRQKIAELAEEKEANAYLIAELRRRFAFEFNGMRMHEHYFEQFEGGAKEQNTASALAKAAEEKYGSYENLIAHVREVAGSRGIGWVVVYFDPAGKTLHTVFVNDHEIGQLAGLPVLLALDLWEHAFMVDYVPAEKSSYVDAFFKNLNWSAVEARFDATERGR
ncbi:MAG TPA: Fe-Mn family superoxide dismutase [Candidatus Paceibacterota bacterium]|nr:Fe-Mn family superoxide dismutase [Candidatus Paceibacterota bacterium]